MAEVEAMAWFIRDGYDVYVPLNDCGKYDLLVTKDGEVSRVSVKFCSAQAPSGSWSVEMRNVSRRNAGTVQVDKFNATMFDLIAVYIGPEDRVVVVPATQATPNGLTIKQGR